MIKDISRIMNHLIWHEKLEFLKALVWCVENNIYSVEITREESCAESDSSLKGKYLLNILQLIKFLIFKNFFTHLICTSLKVVFL